MPSQTRGPAKPRSYHTKSRNGCATCKKRRIKCDERHPKCTNCAIRRLHCPFQDIVNHHSPPSTGKDPLSLEPSPSADSNGSGDSPSFQHGTTDVSVVHLELYNHFLFEICPTFSGQPQHDESYRRLIVKAAFKHHFVLYAMLGLAALSKHTLSPNETYKDLATSFQDKAIAGLDDILTKVDSENCIAVVLFAHLIGVHSFCDTFSSAPNTNFSDFLEALIGSAHLLRGLSAVFYPFWNELATSEVGAVMNDAIARRNMMVGQPGDETISLLALIRSADISESSRETYETSIAHLQRDFDEVRALDPAQHGTTHTAFSWLVTSSPEYLQLMGESRPEALVILAYFAVILHYRRGCWAIGNAGHTLLTSIMRHLGRPWKQWLAWPQSEIGKDFPDVAVEDTMDISSI